jgi:hypothetical protein
MSTADAVADGVVQARVRLVGGRGGHGPFEMMDLRV